MEKVHVRLGPNLSLALLPGGRDCGYTSRTTCSTAVRGLQRLRGDEEGENGEENEREGGAREERSKEKRRQVGSSRFQLSQFRSGSSLFVCHGVTMVTPHQASINSTHIKTTSLTAQALHPPLAAPVRPCTARRATGSRRSRTRPPRPQGHHSTTRRSAGCLPPAAQHRGARFPTQKSILEALRCTLDTALSNTKPQRSDEKPALTLGDRCLP